MKKFLFILVLIFTTGLFINTQAQKSSKFNSSVEKKVGPKTVKVPYLSVISYLGYATPGSEDEVIDGKKFYYIYVWIPVVTNEIGIRMMSPVGSTKIKKPIKSEDYEANSGSKDFFDTYITFERSEIVTVDKITEENVKSTTWHKLAENDDSSEMPKNPDGKKLNSLLRYKSIVGDPVKALTRGLYRVGFTTYKKGEVKGTFLAEVGASVKLPGSAVAKTIEGLLLQLQK